jgi:hypothetical protein
MILSHQHKYLFVEFPRTGTTAVSKELVQLYDGKRILRKHSSYQEFLRIASEEEKKYFVFTCVRNPLDDAVSHYFKLKNDHGERYTDEEMASKRRKRLSEKLDARMYNVIQEKDMDFPTFFRRYHIIPYNNWSSISIKRYDYVMRFENLQDDFATVLNRIGLEPVRPLPFRNTTSQRKKEFWMYYTPDIIPKARRIFGPYMKQWGYEFPQEWGESPIPWWNQFEFDFFNFFRRFYWNYLRAYI